MPGRAPHKVHPAVIDAGVRFSDAVQRERRRLVLIPEVGSAAQDRFVGPVLTLLDFLCPGIKSIQKEDFGYKEDGDNIL